jgi:site-specific DNA-methyltransferase (adenine-specific)
MWVYGSGFPKSHDISKAIDKAAGAEREIVGRYQPPNGKEWNLRQAEADDDSHAPGAFTASGTRTLAMTAPVTDLARTWNGWGTALKPAWEPIIVAMKPLDGTFAENAQKWGVAGLWIDGGRVEGVVPQTTQGASSRIYGGGVGLCPGGLQESNPHPRGRWPANLIHDGSDEVLAGFPQSVSSGGGGPKKRGIGSGNGIYGAYGPRDLPPNVGLGDSGSAARFFYVAKAGQNERWAFCKGCNIAFPMARAQDHQTHRGTWHADVVSHPTQKPLALMRYLVRLTRTPTGGVVLDPFAGGGTTVLAAIAEGRSAIAIELDAGYFDIMRARAQDAMLQVPLEMKA